MPRLQFARVEASDERRRGDRLARLAQADARGDLRQHRRGRIVGVGERHGPVALREPRAVGTEHQGHVHVGRLAQSEQPREVELAWGRVGEIRAAHHLLDALLGIIDDHREVVGEGAVVAAQHEVVDRAVRTQPQRGTPARRLAFGALRRRQVPARAGIGALGRHALRRRGRLADLPARAVAGVHETAVLQARQRLLVQRDALRLPHHRPVPVEPDRREVRELALLELRPHAADVQVLHPHQKTRPRGSGEEPREQRGPQVAEVQVARRAGCEAAVRHASTVPHVAEKLSSYKRKRDFAKTPEPAGKKAARGEQLRFVIQEHHATRLHWDLRLEHDGAAASWAVPNGIPQDPDQNRLAVHTEDHPIEYLEFEGDIPKGEYGAGKMRIWDAGTYELEKWRPNEVILTFNGDRVQGRYALFQTRGNDWMIHRMDPPSDPDREPMPERIVPMLAKLGELPQRSSEYGFEVKWDAIRAVVYSEPGRFRMESRKLTDITFQYPEVRPLGRELGSRDAVLDGEIVSFDDDGRPSFERLQQRMNLTGESQIKRRARQIPVAYVIFDLLYLDGRSLMKLPYEERRERLDELELRGPNWQTPAYHRGEGKPLLAATVEQGLEGVVAKRLDSTYEPGRRSGAWIKVKNRQRTELWVGGWLPGEGSRENRIGALLVGRRDDDGRLVYAGRVRRGIAGEGLDPVFGELHAR